jgi:hypothetical protein
MSWVSIHNEEARSAQSLSEPLEYFNKQLRIKTTGIDIISKVTARAYSAYGIYLLALTTCLYYWRLAPLTPCAPKSRI